LTLVAINALKIAERQLEMGPKQDLDHRTRLRSLGVDSDRQLVDLIRQGDSLVPRSQIVEAVYLDVLDKVSVVNPGYLESVSSEDGSSSSRSVQ
jgi:hypothetical protein